MANNDVLRLALAEQEKLLEELDAKLADLNPIQQQRNNTHSLVSQIRFNLGMPPYAPPEKPAQSEAAPKEPERPDVISSQPIWTVAKTIIEQAGRPMTPGELTETLYGLGFKQLTGRPGREIVRSILNKKKQIFEKSEDGRFTLRKTT
jgi:hypothetical protein